MVDDGISEIRATDWRARDFWRVSMTSYLMLMESTGDCFATLMVMIGTIGEMQMSKEEEREEEKSGQALSL